MENCWCRLLAQFDLGSFFAVALKIVPEDAAKTLRRAIIARVPLGLRC